MSADARVRLGHFAALSAICPVAARVTRVEPARSPKAGTVHDHVFDRSNAASLWSRRFGFGAARHEAAQQSLLEAGANLLGIRRPGVGPVRLPAFERGRQRLAFETEDREAQRFTGLVQGG